MWNDDQIKRLHEILKRSGCAAPGRIVRVLGQLAAVYGTKHMPFDRAALYAEDLSDIDPGALEHAVAELRRTSRWLPSVAEIRERVTMGAMTAVGVACSPEQAWSEVLRKVRSIGIGRVPGRDNEHGPAVVFEDPVTASFMDPTTWKTLGQATNEQLPSERRVFIERYKAAAASMRYQLQAGLAALPGTPRGALPASVELHGDRA